MREQYACLTELLGQSPSSMLFRQLSEKLNEEPKPMIVGTQKFYVFDNSGIVLTTFGSHIDGVRLHIDTLDTRNGKMVSYGGDYPCGITLADSSDDIERKIGSSPTKSERQPGVEIGARDLRVSYALPPFQWSFTFDAVTQRMAIVSVIKLSTTHPASDET